MKCRVNIARAYLDHEFCDDWGYQGLCDYHRTIAYNAGLRFSEKRRLYHSLFNDLLKANEGYALKLLIQAFGEGIIAAESAER